MKPKISVITVSYNSEKTIAETIESVLNQTYDKYDYLIVDGKSTDKTVDIAENYRQLFADKGISYRVISEPDKGIYDAMNKGIAATDGEIVGIINSDDYYNPDTLEKVAAFYAETAFDVMYGDLRIFGEGKEYVKRASLDKNLRRDIGTIRQRLLHERCMTTWYMPVKAYTTISILCLPSERKDIRYVSLTSCWPIFV